MATFDASLQEKRFNLLMLQEKFGLPHQELTIANRLQAPTSPNCKPNRKVSNVQLSCAIKASVGTLDTCISSDIYCKILEF